MKKSKNLIAFIADVQTYTTNRKKGVREMAQMLLNACENSTKLTSYLANKFELMKKRIVLEQAQKALTATKEVMEELQSNNTKVMVSGLEESPIDEMRKNAGDYWFAIGAITNIWREINRTIFNFESTAALTKRLERLKYVKKRAFATVLKIESDRMREYEILEAKKQAVEQAQQTIQTLQSPEFIEMAEVANNHVSVLWGKFDCKELAKKAAEKLTQKIASTNYENMQTLVDATKSANVWEIGVIQKYYREVRRAEFIETGAVMVITFQKANGEIVQRYGTTASTAKDYFRTVSGKPFQGNIPNGNKINYIEFNVESGQCDGFKSFIVENFIDARPLNSLEADFINKTFAPYFAQRQKNSVETLELFAKNDY